MIPPAARAAHSVLGRNEISDAGWARQVTQRNLQISSTIAGVNMRLNKGAVRELHWHQSAEWAYMLAGTARVTGVDQEGRTFVGDTDLVFLETFTIPVYPDISLTEWITHLPATLLKAHLGIDKQTLLARGTGHRVVVPS